MGEPILCLNGTGAGLVNHVCVLTDAAPGYSPDHRALLSVSVLGLPVGEDLSEQVRTELAGWYGPQVNDWQHLRTDRIRQALPEQPPSAATHSGAKPYWQRDSLYLCGDHCSTASIEGAVVSGKAVAEAILHAPG